MPVEAGGPERRRVGLGRRVDAGAALRQQAHDVGVAGGGRAPQRRRALDRLQDVNSIEQWKLAFS